MNSITIKGYISIDVENPKGGYYKPYVVITKILDHRNGHTVRPNRVALKYLDLKKNVDPNAHEN
jgi:hypothetical protein